MHSRVSGLLKKNLEMFAFKNITKSGFGSFKKDYVHWSKHCNQYYIVLHSAFIVIEAFINIACISKAAVHSGCQGQQTHEPK